MDNNEVLYGAVKNYFDTLEYAGYLSDVQVYKLLMFDFLLSLLSDDNVGNISEEDYKVVMRHIHCLMNSSCLIPNDVSLYSGMDGNFTMSPLNTRITEDSIIRITEENSIRITEL